MKIVFTSLLIMIMAIAQAMPNGNDSLDNGKKTKSSTTSIPTIAVPALSMQQLLEENAALKVRLVVIENKLEDEKALLQYNYTMLKLVSNIEGSKKSDKIEDMKSHLNFSNVMSNTLFLINKESIK